ncbi:MAG: zf-HC2 domain-containing protein [Aureliella sp.]
MNSADSQWEPCPPGTFDTVVGQVNRSRAIREFATRGSLLVICAFAIFGGAFAMRSQFQQTSTACSQVATLLPAYVAGQLDEDQTRLVDAHLQGCERCRVKLSNMRAMQVNNSARRLDYRVEELLTLNR